MTKKLAPVHLRIGGAALVSLVSLTVYLLTLAPTVNRGRYLETYGRYDDAMQFCKRALAPDPNSTLAQQAVNNLRRGKQNLGLPAGS